MTDWLNASRKECADLHRRVKRFLDERNLRSDRLLEAVYAGTTTVGSDDFNNLRKGSLGRKKVNLIARWFEEHHPSVLAAPSLTTRPRSSEVSFPEPGTLATEPPRIRWNAFIQEHGVFGQVDVRLINPRSPIDVAEEPKPKVVPLPDGGAASVKPPDRNPLSETVLRLNEPFYFAFDPPVTGTCLAIQQAGYPWWEPLPLEGDESLLSLKQPTSILPCDSHGAPMPLMETETRGRHRFLFIFASEALLRPLIENMDRAWLHDGSLRFKLEHSLDDFADQLVSETGQWHILRLDVMFVE